MISATRGAEVSRSTRRVLSGREVFIWCFLIALASSIAFLVTRGEGWDGDTLISASQLVRLLNPRIFDVGDLGAYPKVLSMLLFGTVYLATGSIRILTPIAMLLTATMVATICVWVARSGGAWLFAVAALTLNAHWLELVASADNPAFSIPLAVMGVYLFTTGRHRLAGVICLMASSLFRPGAEVLLVILAGAELVRGRMTRPLATATVLVGLVMVAHTAFGPRLAYPTQEDFLARTIYFRTFDRAEGDLYRFSPVSVRPFIASVLSQNVSSVFADLLAPAPGQRKQPDLLALRWVTPLLLLPGVLGLARVLRERKDLSWLAILPAATLLQPIGSLVYGISWNAHPYKHMEWPIALAVMAAMVPLGAISAPRRVLETRRVWIACVALLLVGYALVAGNSFVGDAEVLPGGGGATGWRPLGGLPAIADERLRESPRYRALVTEQDLTYFTLDFGMRSDQILLLEDGFPGPAELERLNLVLLREVPEEMANTLRSFGFRRAGGARAKGLFVKRR